MPLGAGPWFHGFEVRFLVSEGSGAPLDEKKSLKNKSAHVVYVPKGAFLVANLLIGSAGSRADEPLPLEFSGAQPLWRTRLSDGRVAVLTGRVMELDNHNLDQIRHIRETLKPTVNFQEAPKEFYTEIHSIHWSPQGGNVVLVVPMGPEAMRAETQERVPGAVNLLPRTFQYQSLPTLANIVAPNGALVGVVSIERIDKEFELIKNQTAVHPLGTLRLQLEANRLVAGSEFIATPCFLECPPMIGGGSPNNWKYTLFPRFDGLSMTVELRPCSVGLRNKNVSGNVCGLSDSEEIVLSIPAEIIKITASLDASRSSAELSGRFTLRDIG
jgi:hypothetical protein